MDEKKSSLEEKKRKKAHDDSVKAVDAAKKKKAADDKKATAVLKKQAVAVIGKLVPIAMKAKGLGVQATPQIIDKLPTYMVAESTRNIAMLAKYDAAWRLILEGANIGDIKYDYDQTDHDITEADKFNTGYEHMIQIARARCA